MKNIRGIRHILICSILVLGGLSTILLGQGSSEASHDIFIEFDEVVLMDVVSSSDIDIVLEANLGSGLTAGESIDNGTVLAENSDNRLHYTIFNATPWNQYKIAVDVSALEGEGWDIELSITPGDFAHSGANGNIYTPLLSLRTAPPSANLLGGINNVCWTGTNVETQGYQLNYQLKVTDVNNFEAGNTTSPITITYTLSEE